MRAGPRETVPEGQAVRGGGRQQEPPSPETRRGFSLPPPACQRNWGQFRFSMSTHGFVMGPHAEHLNDAFIGDVPFDDFAFGHLVDEAVLPVDAP